MLHQRSNARPLPQSGRSSRPPSVPANRVAAPGRWRLRIPGDTVTDCPAMCAPTARDFQGEAAPTCRTVSASLLSRSSPSLGGLSRRGHPRTPDCQNAHNRELFQQPTSTGVVQNRRSRLFGVPLEAVQRVNPDVAHDDPHIRIGQAVGSASLHRRCAADGGAAASPAPPTAPS